MCVCVCVDVCVCVTTCQTRQYVKYQNDLRYMPDIGTSKVLENFRYFILNRHFTKCLEALFS